jgi:hypothetical protein
MMLLLVAALSVLATTAEGQTTPTQAKEYIRVIQANGVWWFEDGTGHRFFSSGVNCVGGCYGHAEETPIDARRKARIVSTLRDWGFNTVGSWSSPSLWGDLYFADQIYTDFNNQVHDVFDERFWNGSFASLLRKEVQPFLGMKNFVGYFLDNEPEWNADQVFEFYLGLPSASPGSQALIVYLKKYYQGSIQRLNREWRASHKSFQHIPGTSPAKPYSLALPQGLVNAWRTEVAATYYRRYAAMVRALDPDHLILGIRHRGVPDLEFFRALTPYFDVHSINDYNRYGHLRPAYAELYEATGKPLMITEFSFSGFSPPGYKSDLFVDVYTQENRGVGYRKYVLEAARTPFMVGMHWFMWMDYSRQHQVVRDSPPDENVGLLSHQEAAVYEELGKWVRGTNAEIDAAHQNAVWVAPEQQGPWRRPLRRFTPTVDGDISEWPKQQAIRPATITALLHDVKVDHRYFMAWDTKYLYVAGDIADSRLDHPGKAWAWQGDYLSLQLSPVEPTQRRTAASSTIFIYPQGGGSDGQQPYAAQGYGPHAMQELSIRIRRQFRPGGYTIEARIPVTTIRGFKGKAGGRWNIKLAYQNVNEIYRTNRQLFMVLQ